MPKAKAVVDPDICQPSRCGGGVCLACKECPNKVMRQEEPGDVPYVNLDLCRGCFTCLLACPLKAIKRM
ncbi:MAG: hypothetical protein Q7T04_05880 [Dehalococcoidia bacterium]|nr:hypothetical protein [Dehalococcoidia bacterium]